MRHRICINRRTFLKGTLGASATAALPTIIPSMVLGAGDRPAPSNRITLGCIGLGNMGNGNLGSFMGLDDCQVLAVCDVDSAHLDSARKRVDERYVNTDCATYKDFRELLARSDIDAISLATPDHWHAIPAILAARAGKDVYGEKPFCHDLLEGRAMVRALNEHGRVWQTGSWQRSRENFRFACELVRNGRIGRVHQVEVGLPTGRPGGTEPFTIPPPELDYEFWVGPSPWAPYCATRTHWSWRWQLDYGGGQLMDWIGHHADIGQWGLGTDHTGPIEIEPINSEWPTEGIWDAPTTYKFACTYKNGVTMIVANSSTEQGVRSGTKWIGEKGWVWVDRNGTDAEPKKLLKEMIGPEEVRLIHSTNHHRNFLDCVKSRRTTITPAEVAHRSASIGHLGLIAMRVGRTIRWNPDTEQILDDPTAAAMLGRAKREPWNIL